MNDKIYALTNENKNLKMQLDELTEKFNKLAKENKELIEQLEWAYEEMSAR